MKTIIVYNSKTGFTERYAKWLADALDCALVPYAKRQDVDFALYDAVVFGSFNHAGTIQKLDWFKKQLPAWQDKKLAVFYVGATPPDDKGTEATLARNLTGQAAEKVAGFYLPGGICYEKMGAATRFMMKTFSSMLAKTKDKTPAESEMARMLGSSYDLSDQKWIQPLVRFLED